MATHHYTEAQLNAVRNSAELNQFRKLMNMILVESNRMTMEDIEACLTIHLAGVVLDSATSIPVRTEVKASTVAGQGVFALVDIEPGQLVTLYPAHCVINTERSAAGNCTLDPTMPAELVAKVEADKDLLSQYMYTFSNINIIGHPQMPLHHRYHGHMINDSCTLAAQGDNYDQYSAAHANVEFLVVPAGVTMIATRKILAGDEVFTTYGAEYWRDNA